MLYFILPMHMPKCDGNQTRYGMTFDITYLSDNEDSVSFTSTIVTKQAIKFDTVCIRSGNKVIKVHPEQLFCEPHGSGYVSRNRYYITWAECKELYQSSVPYVIDFGEGIKFSFKPKKWAKERETINSIFRIIDMNKE